MNRTTTQDLAEDILFLLNCGEGTGRILQVAGYTGREHTLKSRLNRHGYPELAQRLFENERQRWSRKDAA